MLCSDWCWLSLPLAGRTGADLFDCLFGDEAIAVLLESPQLTPRTGRYSILAACPAQILVPPLGRVLPTLKDWLATARTLAPLPEEYRSLPFRGGLVGWFGYDLAWEIERLAYRRADALPFPVAWWFEPTVFAVADHAEDQLWLALCPTSQQPERKRSWPYWRKRLETPALGAAPAPPAASSPLLLPVRDDFLQAVHRIKEHIAAGDIFQGNLSLRFALEWTGGGWQLYRRLAQLNPSPFASYWRTPFGEMISCSPERLVSLRGRAVSTRPIAGTRPRGQTLEGDSALEAELLLSPKERAEHIMLVDLERNDLGRVCQPGSVEVDELLSIERYSHVMHIVSNIVGELQPGYDALDLVRAVFPGGTITGCPKVRCMEIIEQLEPVRRSLFYGSCGYLDRTGDLDLNILIRTLLKSGHQVWGQVGAGIVADSEAEKEFDESLDKAKAQWTALGTA
ncbi:anthranilate synthase component I [Gloeobacter kilaueensis]|uniref:Anthranilate synthase component 1 n=1 Tax=Gloeobacter kilaueensis (strain ATCC BAA-2537 / CCAP 1431/1 / ULC 316 / JS1) TaxID=1183438 RepID=U5QLG6_GLOK1|nr:anthranilate synthase component I [Gloeobacter kilaueensis]AGY58439.1 anthranilate synthase component I [Gloeobacter kilaueensis JS1]